MKLTNEQLLAGGFFYGRTNIVPPHPSSKVVRNEKIFCIPDVEPIYNQPEKKSQAAIAWLQEVMKEAKRVGISIQFSYEPRDASVEDGVTAAEAIIAQYPLIDRLEIITQECGGTWNEADAKSVDGAAEMIRDLFGADVAADNDVISPLKEGLWQLTGTAIELAKNVKILGALRERWSGRDRPGLTAGVYCTDPVSLRITLAIMRHCIPQDVELAFLPAHGARAASEHMKAMGFTASDLERTMLYSWIEFDGDMFLQENTVLGTKQTLENIREIVADTQIVGLAFNHWRTAENRTGARYASLATINGPFPVEEFYKAYGTRLGIGKLGQYARAMQMLDDADTDARNRLGNIGFCHEPCWQGPTKLGYVAHWNVPLLDEVRGEFEAADLHARGVPRRDRDGDWQELPRLPH